MGSTLASVGSYVVANRQTEPLLAERMPVPDALLMSPLLAASSNPLTPLGSLDPGLPLRLRGTDSKQQGKHGKSSFWGSKSLVPVGFPALLRGQGLKFPNHTSRRLQDPVESHPQVLQGFKLPAARLCILIKRTPKPSRGFGRFATPVLPKDLPKLELGSPLGHGRSLHVDSTRPLAQELTTLWPIE